MQNKQTGGMRRATSMAAVTALAILPAAAMTAHAASDSASLEALVQQQAAMLKQQSQQISALRARLDHVETQEQADHRAVASLQAAHGATPSTELASSQPPAGAATNTRSAGKTSTSDAQSIDRLQSRVALLEASDASHSGIDWQHGAPEFISPDGQRSFRLYGRLQFDASTTHGSRFDDKSDGRDISGLEARRLRLAAKGRLSRSWGYKLEYDLANNDASVRDAYVNTGFKLGKEDVALYFGSKYDDRTLDGATSSNKTWFMERSLVNTAVAPDRGNYGLGVKAKMFGASRNWHASLAVTNGEIGRDNSTSDNVTYMSRVHWNPWRHGQNMVHLGAWGFFEDFDRSDSAVFKKTRIAGHFNDNVRIRSRKLSDPSSSVAWGAELATSLGSFAAAAEYGHRKVNQRHSAGDEPMAYDAYSLQAGYFLTGEHHGYSHKSGVWKFPDVKRPVSAGGIGAFEVAARYEALNYDDLPNYRGGNGRSRTFGLNWYPNDWSRVMLNYIIWDTDNRSGSFKRPDNGSTIAARLQVMF